MTGEICDCLIYFRIIAKKQLQLKLSDVEFFGTMRMRLSQFSKNISQLHENCNISFIFMNSENILGQTSVSFLLEQLQQHGVLKMYTFLAHPVFITVVLATDSLPLMCSLFAVVSFLVSGNNEADTQSLASDFVKVNSDQKCSDGEATCRSSVGRLLSKETRTAQNQHQTFLVITI